MATRLANKLVATQVESLGDGRWADGGGLYLYVDDNRRRWVLRYYLHAKRHDLGLGAAGDRPKVTLAKAREKAAEARALLAKGVDPMPAKVKAPAPSSTPTFGDMADKYIDAKGVAWKNDKHRAQWAMTLRDYAAKLRPLPIDEITTATVYDVLQPIWAVKPETASRLRGRIEQVLDFGKSLGHRTGENPAAWKGNLQPLLASPKKLVAAKSTTGGHHRALPYGDVPDLAKALQAKSSVSARALEFVLLTAARTGEALGATWAEIDLDAKLWTVPGDRMKAGKEHRVPLSDRAVEILKEVKKLAKKENGPVFHSPRGGHLSNMALLKLLKDMKVETTAHGLRSSFRDWCGDQTSFPREVVEQCLAHAIGDAVEAAYRRSDALERRRVVMTAWGAYACGAASGDNVVALRG